MVSDPVIISHQSAKFYWLTNDASDALSARPVRRKDLLARTSGNATTWNQSLQPYKHLLGIGPVHILLSQTARRRNSAQFVCHTCNEILPDNSYWQLDDTLFVASPELNFIQMSHEFSIVQMAEYATNLCAFFFLDTHARKITKRSKPLTAPAQLETFAKKMTHVRGSAKALKALKWALPRSASPMESKLYLRLCLPLNDGGYGLPLPQLNYRIDPGVRKSLSAQGWYVADLCWPSMNTIVEYDGNDYHEDASRDKKRTNALEALGWKVFCITKREMFDYVAFDMFAMQVAKSLGKRIRKKDTWFKKSMELGVDLGISMQNHYVQ